MLLTDRNLDGEDRVCVFRMSFTQEALLTILFPKLMARVKANWWITGVFIHSRLKMLCILTDAPQPVQRGACGCSILTPSPQSTHYFGGMSRKWIEWGRVNWRTHFTSYLPTVFAFPKRLKGISCEDSIVVKASRNKCILLKWPSCYYRYPSMGMNDEGGEREKEDITDEVHIWDYSKQSLTRK